MIALGFAVFILWVIGGLATYWMSERGTLGDMFGAINALFSGLAFAGVIYTILLQRKELELQREELVSTREELARSASAQERSEQALRAQVNAAESNHRIAALNNMLLFANECYDRIKREPINDRERPEVEKWVNRRMELMAELDRVYSELFS